MYICMRNTQTSVKIDIYVQLQGLYQQDEYTVTADVEIYPHIAQIKYQIDINIV